MAVGFVAASNGTAATATTLALSALPTGWAAGNLFLLCFAININTITSFSEPSGWTTLDVLTANGTNNAAKTYYRIAQSGDTAPSWSWSGTQQAVAVCLCFSGVDTIKPIIVQDSAPTTGASSTTATAPSIDPLGNGNCHVCFFTIRGTGTGTESWTPPTNFTEPTNGDVQAGTNTVRNTSAEGVYRLNAPSGALAPAATAALAGTTVNFAYAIQQVVPARRIGKWVY